MDLEIIFLGTSAGIPTRTRNVSSIAVRFAQAREIWLFDCGEGTQHQFLRAHLSLPQVRKIFITHLHGDHVLGLFGVMASCGLGGRDLPLEIYGPPGITQLVSAVSAVIGARLPFDVKIVIVEPGEVCEGQLANVSCAPLRHRVPTFGYRLTEPEKPGHFAVEEARKLGVEPGPLFAALKRGESVTLADGRIVDGKLLCGPKQAGRIVAYCTDTSPCHGSVTLAKEADVVIHEATYGDREAHLARDYLHSTARMAAQTAAEASAKKLYLTHFSPRYESGKTVTLNELVLQAREVFPNSEAAHDLLKVSVPLPIKNISECTGGLKG